jgi:hypothetical protein
MFQLESGDVRSLQTLRPAGDFEFNRLSFVQRPIPLRLDRGEMDENVLAGLALDEPISFAGVEPLHYSLLSHFICSLLLLNYLRFSIASSRKAKMGRQMCVLATPLSNVKVIQELQTYTDYNIFSLEPHAQGICGSRALFLAFAANTRPRHSL